MQDLSELLVLMVGEDDSVEATLRACGAHVARVTCGRDALQALSVYDFDLFVFDLDDPQELRMIRARQAPTNIPSLDRHLVDRHLRKPLSLPIVQQVLRNVLACLVAGDSTLVDCERIRQYSGGDSQFEASLAREFLSSAERAIDGLEAGARCWDLARVQREAHGLKGLCYILGAFALGHLCEGLEGLGNSLSAQQGRLLLAQLRQSLEENRRHLESSILKVPA